MDDEKLKGHFQFDQGDLEANRRGDFSEKQIQRFRSRQSGRMRRRRNTAMVLLILGLGLLGLAAVPLFTREISLPAVIVLGFFGVSFLLVALYLFRSSSFRQNYLFGKVQGPIAIVKEQDVYEGHPYARYELYVGGRSFTVTPELLELMKQGDTYVIYYAEGSETHLTEVVSVDRLPHH